MKKIYIIVNIIIFFIFFFSFNRPLFAQSLNNNLQPVVTQPLNNNFQPIIELLQIIASFLDPSTNQQLSPSTTHDPSNKTITPFNNVLPPQTDEQLVNKSFIYYPQCSSSFDNYPLPKGCTICAAGCGPTTVAMIIASLVNKNVNPITIVNYYGQKGYYLGCAGSRASDARNVLSAYGLKITDYLTYSAQTVDQVASDFKGYLKAGWTLFALANYCNGGCGHFFWIVDLDDNNNVWAYDPYYGRKEAPPINENRYYPFPRYRLAFGVKK